MRHLAFAAGLLGATAASAQTPELTVYTYDSFVSDWGPGPQVEAAFEETCGCDLKLVGVEDGAALLARVRLEGAHSGADVVLGLDTNLMAAAHKTGLFAPHGVSADFDLPVAWDDPVFLPYDWGWFAFVHDKGFDAPASLRSLADSDATILIQDPRSSTPGLGLLMWVRAAYGDEAGAIWEGLADNIVTVTKGWSEAYGLFTDGEADMVLSYTTSPAYHIMVEDDLTKQAAIFPEGHYLYTESAARLAGAPQPELADRFMAFILSPEFQQVIPEGNWSFPSRLPEAEWPQGFRDLPRPDKTLFFPEPEAEALRGPATERFLRAFGG